VKRATLMLVLAVLALSTSGCGKKPRHLDPPALDPGEQPQVYPKKYPPPDSPGERL